MLDSVSLRNSDLQTLDVAGRLRRLRATVAGRIVFTTSFGLEDQYLTHLIFTDGLDIDIVTLDTGRLFPETAALWRATEEKYGRRIAAFRPDPEALQALVARDGLNGFYESVEARKACCGVRKVEPLKRALAGASAWVTGLRGDQSQNRAATDLIAFDSGFGLVKANPLADLSRAQVVAAARAAGVPLNPLHDRGFPSIGCAPCTRAIKPGEDERAGRWWWEQDGKKECGLHVAEATQTHHVAEAPQPAPKTETQFVHSDGDRMWAV